MHSLFFVKKINSFFTCVQLRVKISKLCYTRVSVPSKMAANYEKCVMANVTLSVILQNKDVDLYRVPCRQKLQQIMKIV